MKRFLSAACAVSASLAVSVAGLSVVPAAAAPAVPAPPAAPATRLMTPTAAQGGSYTPPAIRWGTCSDTDLAGFGVQCGTLVVPLDYAKPRGAKIRLAVSRLLHRSSDADYQGVMLVNPGGPGGSGLFLSVLGAGPFVPGTGDDTYDWIGFDPRGVGDSRPRLTCDSSYFGYDRPNYVPTTARLEKLWIRKAKGYAEDCGDAAGRRLLNHVKTTDTVADMESLRKALGQRKINFYGFSYGTYLGQVYATKHPDRVRRFVLDGVVDPRKVWYQANLDQNRAFEKTVRAWFTWLAEHDEVFGLGSSADEVAAGYYRQLAELDATPAAGVIGPDELSDVVVAAGYGVFAWPEIGAAYAALVNDDDASGIKALYDGANPGTPGSDNGYAMYLATQCTEGRWPRKFSTYRTDNWRVFAEAPFLTWNNAWYNAPCLYWPARTSKPVKVTGSGVSVPVLLISETLDAATPFSGALEVRKRFPSASLIEGVGGVTHSSSLSGVSCVDEAVGRYLATGAVPARVSGRSSDLKCPAVPAPDPAPASGGATARQSAPSTLSEQEARAARRLAEERAAAAQHR